MAPFILVIAELSFSPKCSRLLTKRCITQKHLGYCPVCGQIVSYDNGCINHDFRKERLLKKDPGIIKDAAAIAWEAKEKKKKEKEKKEQAKPPQK